MTVKWLHLVNVVCLSCGTAAALAEEPAQFASARTHLQRGRVEEALDEYDELERAGGDQAQIAIGRSHCFEALGQWEAATDVLTAAVGRDERNPQLLARLAEVQLLQGEFDAAEKAVAGALRAEPQLPLARLVRADLLTAKGQLNDADEAYRWFVGFYNRAQPADAETLLTVARGTTQYARWHSKSQIFEFVLNTLYPDALAADPDCWQASYLSGALLLEKYNRAQALPEFKRALAINPRAAPVHSALAQAALQDLSLADAERHAARALEINPQCIAALLVRADLKLIDGGTSEARALVEEALAVNPHDDFALARLAACDLLEDGPPSKRELDELLQNLDAIGDMTFEAPGRFTRRVVELARRNPHPGVFLTELGQCLEARRKFDLAERFYTQATRSMPQLAVPKTELGMLYLQVGRNNEAAKILDEAFQADPYHVRVSNLRKVLKLLDGYEALTSDHFVVRYDAAADRVLARYVSAYLEEQYPGLVQQFGFEPEARTQFEIFHKGKGLSAHQWFSARMVGLPWVQTIGASTGMIVALASPTASEKPYNWARVVKHEFVHILTLQKTQFNIPHWFTEALAMMSEGTAPPESWSSLLLERVPRGDVMNLDTINLGFMRPKGPDDWNMAYCQSRLYAQYMSERFGPQAISEMLEAYRQNLSTGQAILRVFKVDKPEFEKGYSAYLTAYVDRLQTLRPETAVTVAEAEQAHQKHPDDTHAAGRYAYELLKINRRKEARRIALATLERNASEPLAAVVLAQLEMRSEDLPGAIARLEPALDRKQPHPQVLGLLAELRFKTGDLAKAIELYDLGLALDPDRVEWVRGLAAALLKAQVTDRARPTLERLAYLDSDDANVRQKLAALALIEKDYPAAVRYAKMALEVDVLDVATHRVLAQGYAGLSQFKEAAAEWGIAVELKPDDVELVVELARAEAAAGEPAAARQRLQRLLEAKPDFASAKALLEELK
ncbi:MAG: tetratricopeptide repeat protein [Planctomycetaceae bacterium]